MITLFNKENIYFDLHNTDERSGRMNAAEKQTFPDVFQNTASACLCGSVFADLQICRFVD